MLPRLTGPRHKPHDGGKPRQLVVLLHGVGADGNDLIGLAPYWAPMLPDAEFVSPDGPYPCDMAPFGRQWFSLQDRSPGTILAGVARDRADPRRLPRRGAGGARARARSNWRSSDSRKAR